MDFPEVLSQALASLAVPSRPPVQKPTPVRLAPWLAALHFHFMCGSK
jgi:hypothetical protein